MSIDLFTEEALKKLTNSLLEKGKYSFEEIFSVICYFLKFQSWVIFEKSFCVTFLRVVTSCLDKKSIVLRA